RHMLDSIEPAALVSPDLLRFWREHRYVLFRGLLTTPEAAQIRGWTEDLETRPEEPGKWMKYFEGPDRQLCRIENFVPFHNGLRALLANEKLLDILGRLMGEAALLFKEKINYKLVGGQGFAPHQDAPAFTTFDQHYHITVMVSVDPCTVANGCLEV